MKELRNQSYREALKLVVKGGFFGFFKKFTSKPKLSITMADMTGYGKCSNLTWENISSTSQPSYAFLESGNNIRNLTNLGLYIAKYKQKVRECNERKKKEYNKKKLNKEELLNKYTKKQYRFLDSSSESSGYNSYNYGRRVNAITEKYIKCESEYNKLEKASIYFFINMFKYMSEILNDCLKLSYPTESLKAVKCIIAFFNDDKLIRLLFGNTSSSNRSEISSISSVKKSIGKDATLGDIYSMFVGNSVNRDDRFDRSSDKTSMMGSNFKMDIYFTDKSLQPIYKRFLEKLLNEFVIRGKNLMELEYKKI